MHLNSSFFEKWDWKFLSLLATELWKRLLFDHRAILIYSPFVFVCEIADARRSTSLTNGPLCVLLVKEGDASVANSKRECDESR